MFTFNNVTAFYLNGHNNTSKNKIKTTQLLDIKIFIIPSLFDKKKKKKVVQATIMWDRRSIFCQIF